VSAASPRRLACLLIGGLLLATAGLLRASAPGPTPSTVVLRPQPAHIAQYGNPPPSTTPTTTPPPATTTASPSPSSGPIALSPDDRYAWMVDPDADAVSVVRVGSDANQFVGRVPVGRDPAAVALAPTNDLAFVTNSADSSVTVIGFPAGDPTQARVLGALAVGTEPAGVLVTPDGTKLYVANSNSGDVTVISIQPQQISVARTIPNAGYQPTGLAFANGSLYVSQYVAQLRNNGRSVDKNEGADDGREGRISVINTAGDTVAGTVTLNPLSPDQVGFKSSGSTLDRVAQHNDATGAEVDDFATGCFPNLLGSAVVKNGRAYIPAVGSSPNGPFKFNVNLQSVLSVVNLASGSEETAKTINMNKGIGAEKVGTKLFFSVPSAIAFKQSVNEGYVVCSGIDQVVKVSLGADGTPTVGAPTPVRIFTTADPNASLFNARGKNPRGIVLNSSDTRAYVACPLSRDIAVLDIQNNQRLANISVGDLPDPSSFAGIVLRGKQLFYSSIGPAGTRPDSSPPAGRMSNFGWSNCGSCHPNGHTDGVTWMFPDGPRQTISLDGTFDHVIVNNQATLDHTRILNWSAVRDEVQDFELNTRAVSGGEGLIRDGKSVVSLVNPDGSIGAPNTGRDSDLDSMAFYMAYGIRTPNAPPISNADFQAGSQLFADAGCTSCHAGRQWTTSIRNFTPPPKVDRNGAQIVITDTQLVAFLRNVGTFDPTQLNEVRANVAGAVPPARGTLGLNPPSLLGLAATAPYFHSGQAQTLDDVMANIPHRTAGSPGRDLFTDANNRALMVKFLRSIDANKPFFPGQ
jgi:YVTN family beta-propeller protein